MPAHSNGVHAGADGPPMVFGKRNVDYSPSRAQSGKSTGNSGTYVSVSKDIQGISDANRDIANNLDEYLELDGASLIVRENGVIEEGDYNAVPEQGMYGHHEDYINALRNEGWELMDISNSHTSTPYIAHTSESLSGSGVAFDIVSSPGEYATVSLWSTGEEEYNDYDDEYDGEFFEPEPIGWMLLKRENRQ